MSPGRRRRRVFSDEQFDPQALEKLERAGARWLQRTDGTWARWSYLGNEWVDEQPPKSLVAAAGPARQEATWTDETGAWARTTDPPPLIEQGARLPEGEAAERAEQEQPARAPQPSPWWEEFGVATMAAAVGLFIAFLVRAAVSLVAEPIGPTVFVPWLWDSPHVTPSLWETVRGLLLLSVVMAGTWVGLRRLFLAYRMPPLAASLSALALVAGLWLTGYMLGRPA